jgi:hypothetical protein
MNVRAGIPLRPDPDEMRERTAASIVRAVLASALATFEQPRDPAAVIRREWGSDRDALGIVTRAASAPAMTTTSAWAGVFAVARLVDWLKTLAPASAGADLLSRGTVLLFDGINTVTVPGFSTASATFASFVGEGAPIPTRQMASSAGVSLTPHKMATIFLLTSEQLHSSNAEALVKMVMLDSLAIALDGALFSNAAGSTSSPPGLLNGVSAITAASGGGLTAMAKDIGALVAAVSAACALDLVFVSDPATVTRMKMQVMPGFDFDVLTSNAIPAGTVICVGLPGLVSAGSPTPRIDVSRDAEVAADTVPPSDGSIGSVVLKSTYQTDTPAIRFISEMTWGLRSPSCIAYVSSVTW